MKLAKEQLRRTIELDAAELKTCYVEIRRRAKLFAEARDRAELSRETEKAVKFQAKAQALFRLSNLIAYDISGWEVMPLPEEDWQLMPEGKM